MIQQELQSGGTQTEPRIVTTAGKAMEPELSRVLSANPENDFDEDIVLGVYPLAGFGTT